MKISLINCFSLGSADSGNPATVVVGFKGDKNAKQILAKQLNTPVTVFLREEESPLPLLEYFYPQTEMPLCLHGTLAAAHVLFANRAVTKLTCLTAIDNIRLLITRDNDVIQIEVAEKPAPSVLLKRNDICDMLSLENIDIENNLPCGVFSVGSPKLLVPVTSSLILAQLNPDFSKILAWSSANQMVVMFMLSKMLKNGQLEVLTLRRDTMKMQQPAWLQQH